MVMQVDTEDLLSADQVARMIGTTVDYVRWHARKGNLKSLRIAGGRIYHRQDVQDFVLRYV
jgi:MerR HTH family regulatory protein